MYKKKKFKFANQESAKTSQTSASPHHRAYV